MNPIKSTCKFAKRKSSKNDVPFADKGDSPASNGMNISHSSVPPKSLVEPPFGIFVQNAIECVRNDYQDVNLRDDMY